MAAKVVIPSDLEEARALEERLLEEAVLRGYREEDVFAIKLALEEAFINAIKHGNRYDSQKVVRVEYAVTDEQARFEITDEGDGFDPACLPDPTADENIERPCGRGLMLIRAFMDEVEFQNDGRTVRLVKYRGA